MKWLQTLPFKIVAECLNSRLMTDRRMWIGTARRGFRGIFAALSVHVIQPFGLQVVRLQIVVGNRPRWGNPSKMFDLTEILSAQAEQRRAVEFGISAHVVIRVRMERLSIFVAPFFFRLILAFHIDRARIPVGLLVGNIVAAFQNENTFPGRCERVHKSPAARAGPDDDHVVVLVGVHAVSLAFTNLSVPPGLNPFSSPCIGNEKCTAGYSRDEAWRSTRTARNRRERRALPR